MGFMPEISKNTKSESYNIKIILIIIFNILFSGWSTQVHICDKVFTCIICNSHDT